ncbi:MAG TPA: thioesterase family protein [Acidimicrobiales bacterium]|nr:thioesterase family protein [Acidimicrobiales bacterium]
MADALFTVDEGRYTPTDFARGPWTPDALHGGPVAALVALAAERCEAPGPMYSSRLTVELLRPVPVAPLAVEAAVSRPGRKVQLVDVTVRTAADGAEVAWGRLLRIRALEPDDPRVEGVPAPLQVRASDDPQPPGPGHGTTPVQPPRTSERQGPYRAFHSEGAELRFVRGAFDRLGPSTVWIRLAVPVVDGEDPTPMQRAAAAADFTNGVSTEVPFGRFLFINPDLTVALDRPPVGEWIGLEARTAIGAPGTGLAQSLLWDEIGPVGRSMQSLVVERMG